VIVLIMIALLIFAFDYKPGQTPISKELQNQKEVKPSVDLSQFKNAKENEGCLKCHGQSKYTYENPEQGRQVNKRMYGELIINPDLYYTSNHRQFKCTDCHSEDYATFPHPGNLRMESKATCIDCHGGDEQYAKFHFEEIDTGFMESVHSTKHSEEFTCWMCHNAHTYKINARTNETRAHHLRQHDLPRLPQRLQKVPAAYRQGESQHPRAPRLASQPGAPFYVRSLCRVPYRKEE